MSMILAVGAGGGLGSILRYLFVRLMEQMFGADFPYGTLGVNVIGGLIAGLLSVMLAERFASVPEWRGLLMIGILGGFTTFSAFSVETLRLFEQSGSGVAALNLVANVVMSLLACFAGMWLARQ